ncbi:TPA: hypothetical protein ACPZRY_001745 [Yersinia enterocolitica]|uniref:hypothetical protein n=1 Tax=Yersinia enterocolitica TaxID=630 RepID=UPI0033044545|nr:hypothetical protein [Yersinia enterocolitica]EKN4809252.1 hypothetical protein [Yersinia enterocolitica]HDL7328736.1 hypothetical protein [Yersinia enterocolitica]HDL7354062.1 hypothetical protein [Yersinia enterocolitica]HDL7958877.1 hypothetical protein [Yersinia enterocolitica]
MTKPNDNSLHNEVLATISNIENRFNIELKSLFDQDKYTVHESIKEYRRRVIEGVNIFKGFDDEGDDRILSEASVELEPNIFISRSNALIASDYTGSKVTDWVKTTNKNLNAMAESTSTTQFVVQTLGGTLIAVGVPVAIKVAAQLIGGETLKNALMVAIRGVGLKSAIVAVVLAIAAIFYWLIWGVEQKILGVIINDTDTDYYTPNWRTSIDGYEKGNLYMEHGTTVNYMSGPLNQNLDSPEIQLKSRFVDINDSETMVAVGLFFADRKAGFRGAEGVYVFIPYPGYGSDSGFSYQFAIPYSKDNRANIDVYNGGEITDKDTIQTLFRDLYNSAKVDISKTIGNMKLKSHLNSSTGGDICGIASISTPITYVSKQK